MEMYDSYSLLNAMSTFSSIVSILTYVFTALALYTIATRRGIRRAWMAWVPVLDSWILGSISDQYRYVTKGQNKSKRKILLTLSILEAVLVFLGVIAICFYVVRFVMGSSYLMPGFSATQVEELVISSVFSGLMWILGLLVLMMPLAIATLVFTYMALYDVYLSCEPDNAVLFLVLSILFNVTMPFFLFFSRDKDKGMPPRRARPEQIPGYESPNGYQQPQYQPQYQQPPVPLNYPEPQAEPQAPAEPEQAAEPTESENGEL